MIYEGIFMKRKSIISRNCIVIAMVIMGATLIFSCDVFMPNFLVGTWYASGPYGDEKLTFSKKGNFTAQFYTENGKVQKIAGKYKAGKSSVQFNYKNKDGKYEKRIALYKMYSREMDFIFKGKKTRFHKF